MSDQCVRSTTDAQLDALSDGRRRRLLFALLESEDGTERLTPIADGGDPGPDEEFRLSMKHVHLPKLVDLGYVDWDREAETVTRGPRFDELRPLLKLLYAHERGPALADA